MNRYQNETRRLYRVMDTQLAKTKAYLVGEKCTIADIACWGWVAAHSKFTLQSPSLALSTNFLQDWAGVETLDDFPNLNTWLERMLARPGVEAGRNVPSKHTAIEMKKLSKEELDKRAAEAARWVQQGMAEDAKKK
jgi:glutathione S-transferase